jgi:predicted DNA-binding transcriptional regulator AlpA
MRELVTVATLAERLDQHPSTVWRHVEDGTLPPPVYIGPRAPRWFWDEIEAAVQTRRMLPREAAARRRAARTVATTTT